MSSGSPDRAAFLGIDGGGTKTSFLLLDGDGRLLARHVGPTSYYLEIGFEALRALLRDGVAETLRLAGLAPAQITSAFAGLPANGEDSALAPSFDALLDGVLPRARIGNDMICSWAGSLGGDDGISLVAGTGSMAYGQWGERGVRTGGWGEVFGDEGSAYWLAREGLGLFSRMSDGRAPEGPLLALVRAQFQLAQDLDLCAAINGDAARSRLAQFARLVSAAAADGDTQAGALLTRAGEELAALAVAVARRLALPADAAVPVSYTGGVFEAGAAVTDALRAALARDLPNATLRAPRFGPELGAAMYAARLAGFRLRPQA
ncbi:BadF/BadG/BcrA/BcrD ATPase family protein [Mitsuaria sp. GD03876]|uniref:BadF/BadG/BcrA/BcrD ATPase family protein n=1 Tax=Mitsuaria sp. GD03876 TaxID=2975399 RepID=UPI00244B175A|nr:BadF/BadG/BcrA/BcrD ATPase family protein [Mitsuaria sp. GD03876]MDH0863316.1 N-acetylglucosamine kinase [Mitsuaria sp. GD03876]